MADTKKSRFIQVRYEDATPEQRAAYNGHPSNKPGPGDVLLFTKDGEYYGYELGRGKL